MPLTLNYESYTRPCFAWVYDMSPHRIQPESPLQVLSCLHIPTAWRYYSISHYQDLEVPTHSIKSHGDRISNGRIPWQSHRIFRPSCGMVVRTFLDGGIILIRLDALNQTRTGTYFTPRSNVGRPKDFECHEHAESALGNPGSAKRFISGHLSIHKFSDIAH